MPWRPVSHKPAQRPAPRRSTKLYDRKWQARRAQQLSDFPICADCEALGVVTPATEVHHVNRHGGDPVKFWASPLASLCRSCHSKRTARGE